MMTNKGFNLFDECAARCVFAKIWQNFVLPLW